jgi:hypothetical protein
VGCELARVRPAAGAWAVRGTDVRQPADLRRDLFFISFFGRPEPLGVERVEIADDPGAIGLWATWTLTLIVLELIGIAIGDELTIAHPGDDATIGFALLAFGGRCCSHSPNVCSIARCSGMCRARARSDWWKQGLR